MATKINAFLEYYSKSCLFIQIKCRNLGCKNKKSGYLLINSNKMSNYNNSKTKIYVRKNARLSQKYAF